MKFGERLRLARQHAKFSQQELVDALGRDENDRPLMTQANISGLEVDPNAKGSLYTCQIAIACGVRPEWLSAEAGAMLMEHHFNPESTAGKLYITAEKLNKDDQLILLKVGDSLAQPKSNGGDKPDHAPTAATQ